MKQLKIDHDGDQEVRFYRGVLTKRSVTPHDNLLLEINYAQKLRSTNGATVVSQSKQQQLVFLVPKRRLRVYKQCEEISYGTIIDVKLMRESKSGKFTVAEVGMVS